MLIDPTTGKPTAKDMELTDEMIMRALTILQTKIDGIAQQMYNTSIVLEYIMEVMSAYQVGETYPLEIQADRLAEFAKERTEQLQAELKEAMASYSGMKPAINLDE